MASSSSSSATVRVEKATSDLLLGPDWTLNIDICDSVNSDHGQAKDVIKAVKKRLQHKNPKVQFLALTLLETLIKNCGDYVHLQVVERDILQEMIKIVKKKTDMQVRDKILVLLDSWQEAFGGPGGKHPQYYWAYAEVKRYGVEFPQRSPDAAPIFTPPIAHSTTSPTLPQPGYGMPLDSSLRLDEAMASESPSLSLSDLDRMQSAVELLSEMLKVVNPNDREAVNDEVITELVSQCRSDQKTIMSLVSSIRDEEVLGQALDLNDKLQSLLAKHDAIASGSPLPIEVRDTMTETPEPVPRPGTAVASTSVVASMIVPTSVLDNEEEEDDDDEFAQLARRNSKFRPASTESTTSGMGPSSSVSHNDTTSSATSVAASAPIPSYALSLPDPPAPVKTTMKDQDIMDLLSLTISSNPSPPRTPVTPPTAMNQGGSPAIVSTTQEHPNHQQSYAINQQGYVPYNTYVAPWSQPQSQTTGYQLQPQPQSHLPPPPWVTDPANPEPRSVASVDAEPNPFAPASSPYSSTTSFATNAPMHSLRPLQQSNSFGAPVRGAPSMTGDSPMNRNLKPTGSAVSHKPSYVSANRFFEDLIERNADGSLKTGSAGTGVSSPYRHSTDNRRE